MFCISFSGLVCGDCRDGCLDGCWVCWFVVICNFIFIKFIGVNMVVCIVFVVIFVIVIFWYGRGFWFVGFDKVCEKSV